MFGRLIMIILSAAAVAAPALAEAARINLEPPGIEAAAWTRGGKQIVTLTTDNSLTLWDPTSLRLVDQLTLPLPQQPYVDGYRRELRRAAIAVAPDGRWAAVTVWNPVPSGKAEPASLLIDLSADRVVGPLVRPALFWAGARVVSDALPSCVADCRLAFFDPVTGAADLADPRLQGRLVPLGDGRRFASIAVGASSAVLLWDIRGGEPLALPFDGEAVDFGFDLAGNRAFVRHGGDRLTLFDLATGARTVALPDPKLNDDLHYISSEGLGTDWIKTQLPAVEPVPAGLPLQSAETKIIVYDNRPPRVLGHPGRLVAHDLQFGDVYVDYWNGVSATIGGQPAFVNTAPWQVELQYGRLDPTALRGFSAIALHNCGGALIRPGWVVTAAHCLLNNFGALKTEAQVRNSVIVRAGFLDLDDPMARYSIDRVFLPPCPHPDAASCFHDGGTVSYPVNDIALLRIARISPPPLPRAGATRTCELIDNKPVCGPYGYSNFSPPPETTAPIALPPSSSDPHGGTPVMLTGWGATNADNPRAMSQTLNIVQMAIIDRATCHQANAARFPDRKIPPLPRSIVCAGVPDLKVAACKGDSGGPLVADLKGTKTLVGVVSWAPGCTNAPTLYTRVGEFRPWIDAMIRTAEARR